MEDRYSRQRRFAPIGDSGQSQLQNAHVLIVGAGALGSGNAELLTRSGVGTITIVDRDYVEWSNLQRQSLYCEQDAVEQLPKAVAAARRLGQINSAVTVNAIVMDCTGADLAQLVETSGVDIIVDGTDNFETRYLINDAAYRYRIPWIYGACSGSYGAVRSFIPGKTPCLHCLQAAIPERAASCDADGIIAPTVQMVVSLQSAEVLKWLTANREEMSERYTVFDQWSNYYQSIRITEQQRRAACPTCGEHPIHSYLKTDESMKLEVLCGRKTVSIRPPKLGQLDLNQLVDQARRLTPLVTGNPYLMQIVEDDHRLVIFKDGRALIHGTDDLAKAKNLYVRYLGEPATIGGT
ncbi:ThiF family adenylyltransferase [Gorillibacterium massiliense]|uniref:ThiF family adenylyltransferase n=1 Tax=Gorillibacterium massiliense TaxID=1280390 RepID=UPI0005938B88|nr:ThiF family adenylyltransferase [Gorillibacterium massiliense]